MLSGQLSAATAHLHTEGWRQFSLSGLDNMSNFVKLWWRDCTQIMGHTPYNLNVNCWLCSKSAKLWSFVAKSWPELSWGWEQYRKCICTSLHFPASPEENKSIHPSLWKMINEIFDPTQMKSRKNQEFLQELLHFHLELCTTWKEIAIANSYVSLTAQRICEYHTPRWFKNVNHTKLIQN